MIAIIAGGTGLTGLSLIEALERNSEIKEIRALVRVHGKIPPSPKLKELTLPWNGYKNLSETPLDAYKGDLYFCSLGTTLKKAGSPEAFKEVDLDAVIEFAKICKKLGGFTFSLVSAAGANPNSPIFYSRVKGEAEEAVRTLQIPQTLIFRPGLLIGDRKESRPTERIAIEAWRALSSILPEAISHAAGTPVKDLAEKIAKESLSREVRAKVFEPRDLIPKPDLSNLQ